MAEPHLVHDVVDGGGVELLQARRGLLRSLRGPAPLPSSSPGAGRLMTAPACSIVNFPSSVRDVNRRSRKSTEVPPKWMNARRASALDRHRIPVIDRMMDVLALLGSDGRTARPFARWSMRSAAAAHDRLSHPEHAPAPRRGPPLGRRQPAARAAAAGARRAHARQRQGLRPRQPVDAASRGARPSRPARAARSPSSTATACWSLPPCRGAATMR